MMLLAAIVTFLAGSVAFAATPDGFQPGSSADLMVTFNGLAVDASGGKAVLKAGQYDLLKRATLQSHQLVSSLLIQ